MIFENKKFDKYLIIYISQFLSVCTCCNKYDYCYPLHKCHLCSAFFCKQCKNSNLSTGYHNDETIHIYCKKCHMCLK